MTGVALCACFLTAGAALAQDASSDEKLQLSSDELVYNRDSEVVTATGAVQIHYNGYSMVAQRVDYDQRTGRMSARGHIELIEPDGNRIYADNLDITDNFASGFLNGLRVETIDNTRLAAESGERIDEDTMVLNNGVYTACLPCASDPQRAPLWQVKAERVVQNGKTRTIRLEKARVEAFGVPIAFVPAMEVPDHTVKRKSGFLFPRMSLTENLGFGASVPYYWAFSNHADATFTATGYTSQGVLLEGEFRQRFENGEHTLRVAGINQMRSEMFTSNTSDAEKDLRGLVASKGEFHFNPRWAFGWNAMLQSDNNFARTYDIEGLNDTFHTNQAYLTGKGDRNYFDARAYYFDVQDADTNNDAEKRQAIVSPVIDYRYIAPEAVAGGELSANFNFTNISRTNADINAALSKNGYRGLSGVNTRMTGEIEWQRTYTTPQGLLLTPILAARGDLHGLDVNTPTGYTGNFEGDGFTARTMLTAGLEARYPLLVSSSYGSHIFEPIAQVFVRPNESHAGGLPNEDAQSFVFDATNLFERDKFSGYDRIEGGTRANIGFRYTGSLDNGFTLKAIAGQSYQLAGQNSFATDDLVNAGANSGLENSVSDYVAMAGVDMPNGISLSSSVRLDKDDLDLNRTDTSIAYTSRAVQASLTYTRINSQPEYGDKKDNDVIQNTTSLRLNDNWSLFGAVTWDINSDVLTRRGLGFSYTDECMIFSMAFSETRDASNEKANDWTVGARLSFRTLGDVDLGADTFDTFIE
ncbi:LPS-assembly protein LptD [Rhizobiaceae bacterium BDR2-2]|uniref:LPS-assembly protein LptD n=2 Tax=Ectorhizobium quercum TaxID=2965071 RepID=A0AAE3SXG4_9HYPH|nr:LPS-assembly protein LptD [Ectorhizobium quercum]MCX8999024.1 LPS-assembly protein LptD [Ectorhizobium quercum]